MDKNKEVRYGVAFSFETNQSLPDIDILIPKIKLFNDFIRLYAEGYGDMRMWHYDAEESRSMDYIPCPIPPEFVIEGFFIFLGKRQKPKNLNVTSVLDDLDRLFPLYKYVESGGMLQPVLAVGKEPFIFRPGFTSKASVAGITRPKMNLDINLRHNVLQRALCQQLAQRYGLRNVGDQHPSGAGTYIDVVVKRNEDFWFYEIKTAN